MGRDLSARLEALARGVLAPIVLGGAVHPVPPLGPGLALGIGVGRRIVDDDLRSRVDVARVRQARLVAPIDALPDLSPTEWAMTAALNDLMQATNHELSGALTRGRHAKLLEGVDRLLAALAPPRTTLEVLVRHATFARALEVVRTDTTVSWWTGRESFRGQPPPARLLAWPELRRVAVDKRSVPLVELTTGLEVVPADRYLGVVARWLSLSPLTDLATSAREAPAFSWSRSTLALVAYPEGRTLAMRALLRGKIQLELGALRAAADRLPEGSALRALADGFSRELLARAVGDSGGGELSRSDRRGQAPR